MRVTRGLGVLETILEKYTTVHSPYDSNLQYFLSHFLLRFTSGPPRQPRMPATLTLSQSGGADYAYTILGSLAG